jgi:hypothetical protein
MVLGLAARAIEPLIEVLGATTLEVGDDEAGIASLVPHLDSRDDALDPVARSDIRELLAGILDRGSPVHANHVLVRVSESQRCAYRTSAARLSECPADFLSFRPPG